MEQIEPENIFEIITNETVVSLKNRVPFDIEPIDWFSTEEGEQLRADIEIIGDKECLLILIGNKELFRKIAWKMHNISLEPDILPSFVGEFWNFVLGPVIKHIKTHGYMIDISPSRPMPNASADQIRGIYRYFSISEDGNHLGELAIYCISK